MIKFIKELFCWHKYVLLFSDSKLSDYSLCLCGGWKLFHNQAKESNIKVAGDCGNFRPMKEAKFICKKCGKVDE